MNWIEFLFGWVYKGHYEISALDTIMFCIEFLALILLIACIGVLIKKIKLNLKKRENKNEENDKS